MSDPTQPPVQPPVNPGQPAPATQMVPQQQPGQQPPQAYPQQAQPQQAYPPQPGYATPQQAYPPQQGYPPQFPGLPPGAAIPRPPAGSNFSSGKGKTIGLIVAGVVAVGAIGGIGALVFGGGDDEKAQPSSSPGQNSGILDPQPVGSAPPVPSEPVDPTAPAEPTEPAAPTPTPEPEPPVDPSAPPAGDGSFVTLSGNGLQVYVPPGWQAEAGEAAVIMNGTDGAFSYVLTGTGDPALEASSLITQNLESLLPSASYTYELSNEAPLGPFGSIVSLASVEYDGTYVDAQSPLPVTGTIFGATRSDGAVMLILVEHGSIEAYNASSDDFNLLLNETLNAFGGS